MGFSEKQILFGFQHYPQNKLTNAAVLQYTILKILLDLMSLRLEWKCSKLDGSKS